MDDLSSGGGTLPVHAPPGHDDISRTSFLLRFATYVHDRRGAINVEWMMLARQSPHIPDAMLISREALQDHVPELISDLLESLRHEEEAPLSVVGDHFRKQGFEQCKAGCDISELIWEIYIIKRVLKQSVLAGFVRDHPEYPPSERAWAETRISDFFHRLTCDSVAWFFKEQQRVVEEKNRMLEQTGESRERLTRTVSHELRNVLNALTLAITILGGEAGGEERRDLGLVCSRMLADMTRILNDLLDYSALVAGRAQLVLERFFVPTLLEEIVAQWRTVALEQGMTFEGRCDPALGEIVSDSLKLRRIAGNLLSNAIKYRKPARGGAVAISFAADGRSDWKMVVEDTGVGIAREDMELLFGEFNRIRPSSAVTGTGLGLAICKEYVELLGGRIAVSSEAGLGTCFEVKLPMRVEVLSAGGGNGASRPGTVSPDGGLVPRAPGDSHTGALATRTKPAHAGWKPSGPAGEAPE